VKLEDGEVRTRPTERPVDESAVSQATSDEMREWTILIELQRTQLLIRIGHIAVRYFITAVTFADE
jgi:hypothetical protein